MEKVSVDKMLDHAYKTSIEEYELDERELDTILVITERDLFQYIDQKVKNAMAHNERFTEMLVKEVFNRLEKNA